MQTIPDPAPSDEHWPYLGIGLAAHPEDAMVVLRAETDVDGAVVDFVHEWVNPRAEANAGRRLGGGRLLDLFGPGEVSLFPVMADLVGTGRHLVSEVTYDDECVDPVLRSKVYTVYLAAAGADRVVCQYRDVTELRRASRLLAHQAGHDELTGLPNRRLMREHLERSLARLGRGDVPAVLVMLGDLDRFKAVNDTHGHGAGDAVLRVLAQRLPHVLRPGDVVSRYGGDEFLFLCEDVDEADADALARRIRDTVAEPIGLADGSTVVTGLSLGLALIHEEREVDDVLGEADASLYRHKHGRP